MKFFSKKYMLIKNLLYILQSENYNIGRFLRYAYSHCQWWNLEKRQQIKWTGKVKLIYILTYFLLLALAVLAIKINGLALLLIIVGLEIILLPILISIVVYSVWSIDYYLKNRIISKAGKLLKEKKITTIGITGSYGKTSAKEILHAILSEKFSVLRTPENINTDIGIAEFILKNLKNEEILITEMGAHYLGDIKKICDFVKPEYSILTGINEAHLDRFKDIENTIKEKFSLAKNTKKFTVLNLDDENIKNNYSKFKLPDHKIVSKNDAKEIVFADNFEGIKFNYNGENFQCGLLAKHNVSLILLGVEIAKKIGMEISQIKMGINKIKPIAHRLSPIYNQTSNIMVIDDSYNGNKNGIISGLEVLALAKGRKVVLTPGLVELGKKTEEIHNEIGELYSKKADLVLLIKNRVTEFIISGLEKNNFKNYKIYNSTEEAHNDLKNILKSGDTIIFQNDWTDNYF